MPDLEARNELEPRNRIVVLEDEDGDGVMDRSSVSWMVWFCRGRSRACYGGALVLEPPELFFCRDTDGDGRADEKRSVLGGFAGAES